jgi:hypothetical protein
MLEINFNDILENIAENDAGKFKVTDDEILCKTETESDVIYDFLQALGLDVVSGYYDPKIDKRNGEVDELTGYYYVGING